MFYQSGMAVDGNDYGAGEIKYLLYYGVCPLAVFLF